MTDWKKKLLSLKLKYKIILCTMLISTVSLLFITISSYTYFAGKYELQAKRDSAAVTCALAVTMESVMEKIVNDTVGFVSQQEVYNALNDIEAGRTKNYLENYNELLTPLHTLGQAHSSVEQAVMIGKNGEFFGGSELGFMRGEETFADWADLDDAESIAVLPARKSPFVPHNQVIPIVFSLAPFREFYTSAPHQRDESTATIYILVNVNKMEELFRGFRRSDDMYLYLAAEDGTPLSVLSDSSIYEFVSGEKIRGLVGEKEGGQRDLSLDKDNFFVQTEEVGVCGLKIVSVVSRNALLKDLSTVRSYIVRAWLVSVFLVIVLSLLLSRFLTRPLNRLMIVLKEMQENRFAHDFVPKYEDEIGLLSRNILEMYDTIQRSMGKIREEERKKVQAQLQLLSEQINPHFLYNTLECIHGEILNRNMENSASMIESLGKYLRTGLNLGEDTITFQQEAEHTQEYMKLMNRRARQEVDFSIELAEELSCRKTVKCILQPLVENCMKHGFSREKEQFIILRPLIRASITIQGRDAVIEVTDNGHGIDLKKAENAIRNKGENAAHIGLGNVYSRLQLLYGKGVKISFSSVPFCKNTVKITIPMADVFYGEGSKNKGDDEGWV